MVLGRRLRTLLDGCAGVNSIAEETVVGMINAAREKGIKADAPEFPIVQLERWDRKEEVTGVAAGAVVQVVGAVVLRVQLILVSKQPGPSLLVRAKIFSSGSSEFKGLILGGRALDCEANGGLGFRPMQHGHVFEALGALVPRMEVVDPRPDKAYAYSLRPSAVDSEDEDEPKFQACSASCRLGSNESRQDLLLYDEDPIVLEPGAGALVPVIRVGEESGQTAEAVLQIDIELDVVPGLWGSGDRLGMVFVCNLSELDVELERGKPVAAVVKVAAQTRVCMACKQLDSEAWEIDATSKWCHCGAARAGGTSACRACGGPTKAFAYQGCEDCGHEAQKVKAGSVYHIVEEPGRIDTLVDVLCPNEYYYEELRKDLGERHPQADMHVLDHLLSLEAFFDRSIVAGFSYGCEKAQILVLKGQLLGHFVSRSGSEADGSRVQAIGDFAPLKEKLHIQQFLGSTNWLRQYLDKAYSTCVKILGEYMKPGAVFPTCGLGAGDDPGSKAVKAIKLMCQQRINLEVLDEAAAIDGSRPLEQVADCSGIGWGGTGLQMRADLSSFKVLFTAGKGLTPAQQAWPPLTLEGYAQLMTKRAQRAALGSMRSICWTDHANLTKQQVSEDIDVKHLRWISEIISDGSQIRSLSGRAAKLGDGFSRNPAGRDEILAQRTKDLAGLCGQLRGFDIDEFLSDHEQPDRPVPWTMPSDSIPDGVVAKTAMLTPASVMASAGVMSTVKILYVTDYVPSQARLAVTSKLWQDLSRALPDYQVSLALAEGPFEDDTGDAHAHFAGGAQGKPPAKKVLETKKDLLTSVIKVLRNCSMHRPQLLLGDGQGGLVALAIAKPLLVEAALAARNVQREEVESIAQSWGSILAIVVRHPRIGKAKVGEDLFRLAAPEVYADYPEESLKVVAILDRKESLHEELVSLYAGLRLEPVSGLADVQWQQLLEQRPRTMWSHNGCCACGRKSYLFGRCSVCVKEEAKDRHEASVEKAAEGELEKEVSFEGEVTMFENQAVCAMSGNKGLIELVGVPPVADSGLTAAVAFISDRTIVKAVKEQGILASAGIKCVVQDWKRSHSFRLATLSAPGCLRIVFAVDEDAVLPLQQCCSIGFETAHEVLPEAWTMTDLPIAQDWVELRQSLDRGFKEKPALKVGDACKAPEALVKDIARICRCVMQVRQVVIARGQHLYLEGER